MRLLLHDTLTTTSFVEPLRRDWIEHDQDVALLPELTAGEVGETDAALIPSPEATLLVGSHLIVPEIAVVDPESSAIAMRTPVRPDEIEQSAVVLWGTSAVGEVLARALLWPFFGITVTEWLTAPDAQAQVTIVEGPVALQQPEAGLSLDLGRSWFVMTGQPIVSHVLVMPASATADQREQIVELLKRSAAEAHTRRRELRLALDEVHELPREVLVGYLTAQRLVLEDEDRDALVALLVRGAGGSRFKPLTRLPFADSLPAQDQPDSERS